MKRILLCSSTPTEAELAFWRAYGERVGRPISVRRVIKPDESSPDERLSDEKAAS